MARPQPQSTREEREEKVQSLILRMSAGVAEAIRSPDAWRQSLENQARFHQYSWGNQVLILLQRPDASQVAGYQTWRKHGRQVRKGEKGIAILAPVVIRKTAAEPDPATGAERETVRTVLVGFRIAHVFDWAQTDPIPGWTFEEVEPLAVPAQQAWDALVSWAQGQGLTVQVRPANGANGYYSPHRREIVVSPLVQGLPARVKVLAHECAHSILHPDGYDAGAEPKPRELAELEAESAAYVAMAALGLDTKEIAWSSFAYVASWKPEPKAVVEAGDRIARAARQMIAAVLGTEAEGEAA